VIFVLVLVVCPTAALSAKNVNKTKAANRKVLMLEERLTDESEFPL
jgi:hypothetical protein